MTSPTRTPVKVPSRRVIMGQVVEVDEPYAREVAVPPLVLFPLVIAAVAVELVGLLISTVFRTGLPTARRPLKALRKGPEYMVTPIWVRDADDTLVEVEVHGYLNRSALIRRDRIRTVTRRQKGDLPLLAGPIENLTTSRTLRPRRATLWTHLGLGLVLQGILGALLIGAVAALSLGALR
ncbi:MAG: hypothetical protein AUI14_00505 [Actinobacteria bacterium 13_2_20CM_2_71_6]|nr:MAG: hypothetical protein AUI14_00505 [Actinobacteria bacterium 13_2_20CM_2_71_6]